MSSKIEQWRELATTGKINGSHLLQACDYLEELEKDLNDLLIENREFLEQIINQRSTTEYYSKELEDAKARMDNTGLSKSYLLSWIKGLTLADHLGDVLDDVDVLLKKLGEDGESGDMEDLQKKLTDRGVPYLYELDELEQL